MVNLTKTTLYEKNGKSENVMQITSEGITRVHHVNLLIQLTWGNYFQPLDKRVGDSASHKVRL